MLYSSHQELMRSLTGILSVHENELVVQHGAKLRTELIESLLENTLFSPDKTLRNTARFLIMACANYLGVLPSSLYNLYVARSQGDYLNKTIPLVAMPGMSYDIARAAFVAMKKSDCGLTLFELQSHSAHPANFESPENFVATVLAAAIREGFHGPVFIQLSLPLYDTPTTLLQHALNCGVSNYHFDATHLIEHSNLLRVSDWHERQVRNSEHVANAIKTIGRLQSADHYCAIGAEVGVDVDGNTPLTALESFMEALADQLRRLGGRSAELCKVAVELRHDTALAEKLPCDVNLLKKLRDSAISHYQLAGVGLRHLPRFSRNDFKQLPHFEVLEADISTLMLNSILDSSHFPEALREEMLNHLKNHHRSKWGKDESADDFFRRLRHLSFMPLKNQFWEMDSSAKENLRRELTDLFTGLFQVLNVNETTTLVRDNIRSRALPLTRPNL